MIKKLVLLNLWVLSMHASQPQVSGAAAASQAQSAPTTIEVSLTCNERIKNINKDGGVLYYYLKGVFQGLGEANKPETKPSDILRFFEADNGINEATKLSYMPASEYLSAIISAHYAEFDAEFQKKQAATQNTQETWEWFDGYFKQKGLIDPLTTHKKELVAQDQKRRALRAQGITFSNGFSVGGNQIFSGPTLVVSASASAAAKDSKENSKK